MTIACPGQIYLGFALPVITPNQPHSAICELSTTPPTRWWPQWSIRMNRWGVQPQDRDYLFRDHVEARAAHRRQQRRVPGNLQFHSVVSGHQQLPDCVRRHELHVPSTPSFRRRLLRHRRLATSIQNVYGLTTNVFGPYSGSLKHSETLQLIDEQGACCCRSLYRCLSVAGAAGGTGHSIVLATQLW